MRALSRRMHAQASAPVYAPPKRDELEQTLQDFLAWVEQSKGLSLCEAFKPQYDWYMPTIISKQSLVREFLRTGNNDRGKQQELAA